MDNVLGHVVGVAGSQITATLEADQFAADAVRVGAMIRIPDGDGDVIGTVSAVRLATIGTEPRTLFEIDLLGQITVDANDVRQFSRGVSKYPLAGAAVRATSEADITTVYIR